MRRHINFFLSSIGECKEIWASFLVLLLTTYEKLEKKMPANVSVLILSFTMEG